MISWFTWIQVIIAVASCIVALGVGIAGRKPNDLSVGGVALSGVLLLVQIVLAIVGPVMGNQIVGDGLEFWMYCISAFLIAVAAVLWSLIERERWSNAVLSIAAFSIAVMVFRMQQVWDGSAPLIGA